MNFPSLSSGGHYDENGKWVRTRFCLVSCGESCNCCPRNGIYQLSAEAMKKRKALRDGKDSEAAP